MAQVPLPPMPADVRREFRDQYDALPSKRIRWDLQLGFAFLTRLADLVDQHGVKSCAHACGVGPGTVYTWLNRRIKGKGEQWPAQIELGELRRAWRLMKGIRQRGHYARRQTPEFEQVHDALTALLGRYDITVIAAAMDVPTQSLKRFLAVPENTAEDRADLAELVRLAARVVRARRSPSSAAAEFERAVVAASRRLSPAKIARALKMDVRDVELMLDQRESG